MFLQIVLSVSNFLRYLKRIVRNLCENRVVSEILLQLHNSGNK